MRNTQVNISSQQSSAAAATWTVDALSTTVAVKREAVRDGIFYWAVGTLSVDGAPELLSSREARAASPDVALFMFEDAARNFQRLQKLEKAQQQH